LNGWEFIKVHKPKLWDEIENAINAVDANKCRTKRSEEKRMKGRLLFSPIDLNEAFNDTFGKHGWVQRRTVNWLCQDIELVKRIVRLPPDEQKRRIEEAGLDAIETYNQTDFVKNRVAVEVQFGKYSFVAHDLFVKHMSFFVNDDRRRSRNRADEGNGKGDVVRRRLFRARSFQHAAAGQRHSRRADHPDRRRALDGFFP
jgi:hypothetical protein